MIAKLIRNQVKDKELRYEDVPYWLTKHLDLERLDDFLRDVWSWASFNASRSHDNRPWSDMAYWRMRRELYPDELPF